MELKREDLQQIFRELCEPLPEAAIQRTRGRETGKGYDTDGYGYQWLADRLNEVVGIGCWTADAREAFIERGQTAKGRAQFEVGFDVCIALGNWHDGTFAPLARTPWTPGNHTSVSLGDARKGALTNAFKKAAAFFGLGAIAFRGELDPDNRPQQDSQHQQPRQGRPPLAAVPDREPTWNQDPGYDQGYDPDYDPGYDQGYDQDPGRQDEPLATDRQIGRLKGEIKRAMEAIGKENIIITDERFITALTGQTGRLVTRYDDLTRQEASELIDAAPSIIAGMFQPEQRQRPPQQAAAGGNGRRRLF